MDVGMNGDVLLGATPVGLPVAQALSKSAVEYAIEQNPLSTKFKLTVNNFLMHRVQKFVKQAGLPVGIEVHGDVNYPRDQWLMEPLD